MKAIFEKSFYERLVDFYNQESLTTGKKVVRILLGPREWAEFLNDKELVSKAVRSNLLCKKTKTLQDAYSITLPDYKQQLRCVTIARRVEGE